ncbi:MAG TPA: SRPBCC family protein [Polyangia bacterium]|nr:SRPBCC family protein [Polyangia bacterium]
MSDRAPVERRHVIAGATPAQVYDVVSDFAAYPRLFPEMKATRVLSGGDAPRAGGIIRVEFRLQIVLPVRYVLDLVCDPAAHTMDWTFVEGEIVTHSVGSWRLTAEGDGTAMTYRVSLDVKAPVPGFVLRKVTDGLVAASIPAMFRSIEREVHLRHPPAQVRET